eukprot:752753-Hanusia_phi.AAC.7
MQIELRAAEDFEDEDEDEDEGGNDNSRDLAFEAVKEAELQLQRLMEVTRRGHVQIAQLSSGASRPLASPTSESRDGQTASDDPKVHARRYLREVKLAQ